MFVRDLLLLSLPLELQLLSYNLEGTVVEGEKCMEKYEVKCEPNSTSG